MHHFLLTICLIASIVACPLRCVTCESAGHQKSRILGESVRQPPRACQCCTKKSLNDRDGSSVPTEQEEETRGDDCLCPNCICEGATLSKVPELAIGLVEFTAGGWVCKKRDCQSFSALDSSFDFAAAVSQRKSTQSALSLRQTWRV